ncbi:MAG: 1,4-dihydroxy-2-naphthoate octaprenyltransferase [Flavobacteriaceae bacterium]
MSKAKAWLQAARLRTLPLSVSGIIVGTALAGMLGYSDNLIFLLALLTTIGFQITSNFANDYGDGVKGTDNDERIGPKRALQSGALNSRELKRGILLAITINLILVICLLYVVFGTDYPLYLLIFGILGILCIWAAVKYTIGSNAYGYKGMGDIFVLVFFGLVGVLGSLFLYTKTLFTEAVLPAMAIGLLSTAVLNLNNMRDLEPDRTAGKQTLAVLLGPAKARVYHFSLILGGMLCIVVFNFYFASTFWQWLNLLAFIPLIIHMAKVHKINEPAKLDPELKKIALSTFLLALLFHFTYNFL